MFLHQSAILTKLEQKNNECVTESCTNADLQKFAQSAASLARNCNYEAGCPKCLYLHSCPQDNEFLNKQIGLKLLEAMF